ncbi:MAG: hypothetical protein JJT96_15595 [Opitutales bacterium]|nr:hypothetical protein [Opitutales bacterium]
MAQLTEVFRRLGAPPAQAATMARQLWKRSGQLALERDIPRVEALEHLLRLAISGVHGEAPLQSAQEKE